MASNAFGNIFRITTFGESHGKAIGVVIDGCPAGLSLTIEDINTALARRAPGQNPLTSPRKEVDSAEIYAGVFEGYTTGAPIAIIIPNKNADSAPYEAIKNVYRPGHANFTYLEKYGVFDYRGGGRASARETAARVAAAAVAKKLLDHYDIEVTAFLCAVGETNIADSIFNEDIATIKKAVNADPLFCPDQTASLAISQSIMRAKEARDSLGGIVGFLVHRLPIGLGEPVYEKLEANLAKAMLSLPATKGFEIGEGFAATVMQGSQHNDAFQINTAGDIQTATNHAGGTLGGLSTGMPLYGRVAFKPTSSIKREQKTVDREGNVTQFKLAENAKHDPCVAIRAVPIVEAMCTLVIADHLLMGRCSKI